MAKQAIRVGIDLTAIWRRQTGIFRYTAELAKHLLVLPDADSPVEYVLFFSREIHADFLPLLDHFTAVIAPTTNELLLKQCWFPLVLPGLHLDVIHYPAFPPPYLHLFGPRTVMTLHDAGPWRYASALTLHGRLYFRTLLTRGLHTCTRVITVSEHARSEIGHFLGKQFLPELMVIPEAARAEFAIPCTAAFKQQVRTTYHLPTQYFLTVATVEPRKNLVTLLKAYQQLQQRLQADCPPLVIVGRKGWNNADILQYMQTLEGQVLFPGFVGDDELIALYQMATALVFPSLYEGFGLPILEAMMAGCPVIAAHTSSLPEVAGDAALFVDPLQADEMSETMQRVLHDDTVRSKLIAAGYERAKKFSWEETARMTRNVYILVSQ